jgi:hypothetical protein
MKIELNHCSGCTPSPNDRIQLSGENWPPTQTTMNTATFATMSTTVDTGQ